MRVIDKFISFRVPQAMLERFNKKLPEPNKRSKILRELLRMYLDNEVRVTKITEIL